MGEEAALELPSAKSNAIAEVADAPPFSVRPPPPLIRAAYISSKAFRLVTLAWFSGRRSGDGPGETPRGVLGGASGARPGDAADDADNEGGNEGGSDGGTERSTDAGIDGGSVGGCECGLAGWTVIPFKVLSSATAPAKRRRRLATRGPGRLSPVGATGASSCNSCSAAGVMLDAISLFAASSSSWSRKQ